jgi:hypothetical protein
MSDGESIDRSSDVESVTCRETAYRTGSYAVRSDGVEDDRNAVPTE